MSIPPSAVRQFDEMYVVSDLHLGGPTGFQIFDAGQTFARLVDNLCSRANKQRRVALLVNGDLVDFLAERPFVHFDPVGAVDKLDRIIKDPAFAPVWEALARFANIDHCYLLINLGNHDLELALPWVRERLLDTLSNGMAAARGRITLAFDGAGIRCRVGGAQILAVHGNEVDDWNLADYETIRRIGRDLTQGVPVAPWIPNAGSRLVVEVMNDVKSRFPFVDLLKPEIGAVIPTVLALAPDQRDKVDGIRRTVGRLFIDKLRRRTGRLGADDDDRTASSRETPVFEPTGGRAGSAGSVPFASRDYALALLDEAEQRLGADTPPLSLIDADARAEYLGARAAIANVIRRAAASEVLREAIEGLSKDRSFDLTDEDAQFRALDQRVGDVDFLLAGHTHLERVIQRKRGRGTYFNSGTWVRLIHLDAATLANPTAFADVFNTLKVGTMQALDERQGLVMRRATVVAIWEEQGRVSAELRHVAPNTAEPVMTPVPGTRIQG